MGSLLSGFLWVWATGSFGFGQWGAPVYVWERRQGVGGEQ